MNFLAHLALAGDDPEVLVGGFMGDFVKGRLDGRYPPGIERGIMLHRRIDTFAGSNRFFRMSRERVDPLFGHYRGVLVDLFYDHFLAAGWDDFHPVPLPEFLHGAAAMVAAHDEFLGDRLRLLYPGIFSELIPSYRQVEGIDRALRRMADRISRPNPLGRGGEELCRIYPLLQDDFTLFYPEAMAYAAALRGRQL